MRWLYSTLFLSFLLLPCCVKKHNEANRVDSAFIDTTKNKSATNDSLIHNPQWFLVGSEIKMKKYFFFIDSVVNLYPALSNNELGEYALVHHNSWIIDSLRATDYYFQKRKGKFQQDQAEEIILHKGDTLLIPDNHTIESILMRLRSNYIDVNIPEFKLRLIQNQDNLFVFKVRVGRNAEEYLESLGRVVNQQTPTGKGKIIKVWRAPVFYDLHTGIKLEETKRDDRKTTRMPSIPSLEPSINGVRYGSMFHATTNLKTIGKAYSNGCIGLRESDMWSLYYYAPVGTKVVLRYDLEVVNQRKDTVRLKDIYHLSEKKMNTQTYDFNLQDSVYRSLRK
jgi:L,D-transpeptidase ErfK/SrfK